MNGNTHPRDSVAAKAGETAALLRDWLLHGPAQLLSGAHAGGVAGALDDAQAPRYVYPEITGYYLHWLADIAADHNGPAAIAAARAAAWAQRQLADGQVPATRSYLGAVDATDWRNGALFFFDLAMLLRGLCAAHEAGLIEKPDASLSRLLDELALFISSQGTIDAARCNGAGAALPQRWSTLGGAFEIKASSRVQLAAPHQPLPDALRAACSRLQEQYVGRIADLPLEMLHPTLYFAEGMLVAAPDQWPAIAHLLRRCLKLLRDDGSLPETEGETVPVPRSDIIAQALRIGLLLRAVGLLDAADEVVLQRLAQTLIARVSGKGTIAFRPGDSVPANVWCAMFAEQALRWYCRAQAGLALPPATALV